MVTDLDVLRIDLLYIVTDLDVLRIDLLYMVTDLDVLRIDLLCERLHRDTFHHVLEAFKQAFNLSDVAASVEQTRHSTSVMLLHLPSKRGIQPQ